MSKLKLGLGVGIIVAMAMFVGPFDVSAVTIQTKAISNGVRVGSVGQSSTPVTCSGFSGLRIGSLISTPGTNDAGVSVFYGQATGHSDWTGDRSTGLFRQNANGTVECLLRKIDQAVDQNGIAYPAVMGATFDIPLVDERGRIVFSTQPNSQSATNKAYYHITETGLIKAIARYGEAVLGGGTIRDLTDAVIAKNAGANDRSAVVRARVEGGSPSPASAYYEVRGGQSNLMIREGSNHPLSGGVISSIGELSMGDAGDVVVSGRVGQSSFVLFAPRDGGNMRNIVALNQSLPGQVTGASFDNFTIQHVAINSAGNVALSATSGTGQSAVTGVWFWDKQTGELTKIAAPGDSVSGSVGQSISSLHTPVDSKSFYLDDNNSVFFWAKISGSGINSSNNIGLWVARKSSSSTWSATELIRAGGTVAGLSTGETISANRLGSAMSASSNGKLAFYVNLQGSQASQDEALLIWNGTGFVVGLREGAVLPGGYRATSFFYTGSPYINPLINNNAQVVIPYFTVRGENQDFDRNSFVGINEVGVAEVIVIETPSPANPSYLNTTEGYQIAPHNFYYGPKALKNNGSFYFRTFSYNSGQPEYAILSAGISGIGGVRVCADSIDNDGDGLVDMNDPGCASVSGPTEVGAFSCQDTDGGNDSYSVGRINLKEGNRSRFQAVDTCVDGTTVREYSCSSATLSDDGHPRNVSNNVTCKFGCSNGACNPSLGTQNPKEVQQNVILEGILNQPSISTQKGASITPFLDNIMLSIGNTLLKVFGLNN